MLGLKRFGFEVVGRMPATEAVTGLRALAHKLSSHATVTMLESTDDVDPVMMVVSHPGDVFRIFLTGRRKEGQPKKFLLHHKCADHSGKNEMCSCIYAMAEDAYTDEDSDLPNITKVLMDVVRLPATATICGLKAAKVKSYDLSRTYEAYYTIAGEAPVTVVLSLGGGVFHAHFYSGRRVDGKFFNKRGIKVGDSAYDYVTSNKISQDLVSVVPHRIEIIEDAISKPLRELDFLRGLKA